MTEPTARIQARVLASCVEELMFVTTNRITGQRREDCVAAFANVIGDLFLASTAAERARDRYAKYLQALRDGIDSPEMHCDPLPVQSSWRYVVDKALGNI